MDINKSNNGDLLLPVMEEAELALILLKNEESDS